ncbi:hypothetical protein EYF80_058357 [Liparis tanakae]|uniref:Uncharacterized protein n=1 Tax=Liparis tanakae TaxID=230148 RepID=A0A4Z2ET69_9TELE|nr:hypothetical protein EYF80_058357 [Liparis tanakae]
MLPQKYTFMLPLSRVFPRCAVTSEARTVSRVFPRCAVTSEARTVSRVFPRCAVTSEARTVSRWVVSQVQRGYLSQF